MTHAELVMALKKPGVKIQVIQTSYSLDVMHMIIGIAGEAGELIDAMKQRVIYDKDLDVENIIEELGDLEFYMEGLRQALNITREQTLEHNITKLSKRYEKLQYSDAEAVERRDKV